MMVTTSELEPADSRASPPPAPPSGLLRQASRITSRTAWALATPSRSLDAGKRGGDQGVRGEHRVLREDVVDALRLHAVAGEVEHRRVGRARALGEGGDGAR